MNSTLQDTLSSQVLTSASSFSLSHKALLFVVLLTSLVLFNISTTKQSTQTKKQLRTPPKPFPFLGHILSISPSPPWETFASWHLEAKLRPTESVTDTLSTANTNTGSVILVNLLGSPMVVLNTLSAARELLDRRGVNYSGRPRMAYFCEWLGWKNSLGFLQHTPSHKKQRRLIKAHMSSQSLSSTHIQDMLSENARVLVKDLRSIEEGENGENRAMTCVLDFVSRVVVGFTYGYTFTSPHDRRKQMVSDLGKFMIDVDWGMLMVLDAFPFVEKIPAWFPFMRSKRNALRGNTLRREMEDSFFAWVQDQRISGTHSPSLISNILDDIEGESRAEECRLEQETIEVVKSIGTMMYLAGVETTNAALQTFLLAIVLNPHIQKRAQQEIDISVTEEVGLEEGCHNASFADRKKMPYIECLLREVLRWNPPAPLGVAHRSEQIDEYEGTSIPSNCSIVANIWYMCRSPDSYFDPDVFNPERFIPLVCSSRPTLISSTPPQPHTMTNSISPPSSPPPDPKSIVFGFGRRICPGDNLAEAILWTAIVTILANFDTLPPIGSTLEDMRKNTKFTPGSLR